MTDVVRRHIPWQPSPSDGGPLGRSVEHDLASRSYAVTAVDSAVWRSGLWPRHVPIYDQGDIGDCTANAICGAVSTGRFSHRFRSQRVCRSVYHDETEVDGFGAPWPPNDRGSSGLAACKVAQRRGWITSYRHAFSLNDAISALMTGPVITGVDWLDSFDQPDANGLISITPNAQVRGGHEFLVRGVDIDAKTVHCDQSWGAGWGDHGSFRMTWDTWETLLGRQGDVTVPVA